MLLREVVALLDGQVICGGAALDQPVSACFAADLMSDVLAFSAPHALLVTGLVSVQSVHTADVTDSMGLLFVSGKRPSPEALQLAITNRVTIVSTEHSLYETCGILHGAGLPPAYKKPSPRPAAG